jgi:hypothetical protein
MPHCSIDPRSIEGTVSSLNISIQRFCPALWTLRGVRFQRAILALS